MLGKTKAILALALALVLVSLSTQAAIVTEPESAESEPEMFCDVEFPDDIEMKDSWFQVPEVGECPGGDGRVRIGLFVRWGLLGNEKPGDDDVWVQDGEEYPELEVGPEMIRMVPWDGFLQTTDGGVKLVNEVLFEHGGEYELGGDDFVYPQTNRFTLEWRSSTTMHWDGLMMLLVIPKVRPMPHVTLHTETWSHVFEAWELIGLNIRIPVDDFGNEIEINGFLIGEKPNLPEFAIIAFKARWGHLDGILPTVPVEAVPWDGFISVTDGAVMLIKPLRFETGGDYELGTDDWIYRRTNRFTLEWRSSTTVNWDGVLVALFVPLRKVPEVHMTFHTEQWSHVFEVSDLPDLHRRFFVDNMSNEIEISGRLISEKPPIPDPPPGPGPNPPPEGSLHVVAKVFDGGQDGIENDVMIYVTEWNADETPVEGAAVFINRLFVSNTSKDGTVYVENLPPGEYHVLAILGQRHGKTMFRIESQ